MNLVNRRQYYSPAVTLLVLAVPLVAWGACTGSPNCTVKIGGGGNYTAIQTCANAMADGDTCIVFAGDYSAEGIINIPAGTSTYRTLKTNGSDVVTVKGFTPNSHTKILGNCRQSAAINTCGFNIQNPMSPASGACVSLATGVTDVYITSNVMFACGSQAMIQSASGDRFNEDHIYIQGNTLSYACVAGPSVIVTTTGSWSASSNAMTVASATGIQNNWVVYSAAGLNLTAGVRVSSVVGTTVNLTTINGGAATTTMQSGVTVTFAPPECNGIQTSGDHFVVENNDLSHYTLGMVFEQANFSIWRNNIVHDEYQGEAAGNSHTDFFYSSTSTATNHNLLETNIGHHGVGPDAKGLLPQGDNATCNGTCANGIIFRFNVLYDTGGSNISGYGYQYIKAYNNTYSDLNETAVTSNGAVENFLTDSGGPWPVTHSADVNNIFYFDTAQLANGSSGQPVAFDSSSAATGTWGSSLAYCNVTGATNCSFHNHSGIGNWTDDTGNLLGYANQTPSTNNPNFVNVAGGDFHLQSGSAAIGKGTNLTTANGAGASSTALTVNDIYYFQDGYGLDSIFTTIHPDCIKIGTAAPSSSNTACIASGSINYTTNTMTLTAPLTWANGDPVYLYKRSDGVQVLTGAAPDLGAFPFTVSACQLTLEGVGGC